jgi:glycolate oxidase iron-sulfur subunit
MQTRFTPELLLDPAIASSETVIRKCVHCGFCTATCPTYVLLGDELDSPRGRIYLIKEMLENDRDPTATVVRHVDRCLSCLSCMTTCPSGVNYMHLIDHARAYIEQRYRRPLADRLLRALLAKLLPYPGRFRLALRLARLARPAASVTQRIPALAPITAMLRLAPTRLPRKPAIDPKPPAAAPQRVALLGGCVEPVLRPAYREAAVRLLGRAGFTIVFAAGEGCCGALVQHLGKDQQALAAARHNVDAWTREIEADGLAAIIVTASGCGTTIKDYGFMLRNDPAYAEKAARVSALAKDISELLAECTLPLGNGHGLAIAYHPACSLQHGQKITDAPRRLLAGAGFAVHTPIESHLCCGSAGTYNILQPELAGKLGDRKIANIERLRPDVIATGNIGCAVQIGSRTGIPVVHTIELLDWATGGPTPAGLEHFERRENA